MSVSGPNISICLSLGNDLITSPKSFRASENDFLSAGLSENLSANCCTDIPPDFIFVLFLAALGPDSANSNSCLGTEKDIKRFWPSVFSVPSSSPSAAACKIRFISVKVRRGLSYKWLMWPAKAPIRI